MTKIDEIIDNEIIPKLQAITVANGFTGDVSLLDGYLVHYVKDLMENVDGLGFPCVAIQPEDDRLILSPSNTKSKIEYNLKLIGAVSASHRSSIRAKLNDLLLDVRKALTIDKYVNISIATEITLGSAVFALPEKYEQYAYFETKITLKYVEHFT